MASSWPHFLWPTWVVFNQGQFCPLLLWGYLAISWNYMVVATSGCYWNLVGRGQGCCKKPYNAQDSLLEQRIIQSKIATLLRWRNLALQEMSVKASWRPEVDLAKLALGEKRQSWGQGRHTTPFLLSCSFNSSLDSLPCGAMPDASGNWSFRYRDSSANTLFGSLWLGAMGVQFCHIESWHLPYS